MTKTADLRDCSIACKRRESWSICDGNTRFKSVESSHLLPGKSICDRSQFIAPPLALNKFIDDSCINHRIYLNDVVARSF